MSALHFFPAEVLLDASIKSKRDLLELLSLRASTHIARSKQEILQALEAREKIGSTALGRGVALPHAQLPGSVEPLIIFVRLSSPINFDARDAQPIDLAFLLLWPAEDTKGHLKAMSEICRALRDPRLLHQLRQVETIEGVTQTLRTPSLPSRRSRLSDA